MSRAVRVISSTGASARRLIQNPPNDAIRSTAGADQSNSIRIRRKVASVASMGVATRTRYRSPLADTLVVKVRYRPAGEICTPKDGAESPAGNRTVLLARICRP